MRGHGDADRPDSGYRPKDFASDIAAFLRELGIERAVIAGHSMGSFVAQRFAIDFPNRTLGLVLISSFLTMKYNAAAGDFWLSISTMSEPIHPAFVRQFQMSTIARPVPDTFLDMVVEESRKVPLAVWRLSLEGLMRHDHEPELARIDAPTLICWGDRDAFCGRREQEAMASAISQARLVVFEAAGHAPHWEEPARVAKEISLFLDSLQKHKRRAGA